MDSVGPALAGLAFVAAMTRVPEPARLRLNAVLVIGVSSAYLSGGFGLWELVYPAAVSVVGYRAMFSYRFIGVGWLMHSAWDLAHHLWGNPLWPFMATSSWGCMIFDAVIGLWFVSGLGLRLPRFSPARQKVRV
ncbi:MAG: hypothetical protein JNK82_11180 [Myxococcaceae bacterium]|nr:hypothetical protein [Myxococcaceae bacterium]